VGQDLGHHQGFVAIAVREQRTDGAVDQARDQRLAFRGCALALEIAARNLAGGVIAFLVIHGEREEIHALFRVRRADHGGQHDGFTISGQDRTIGLAGNLAGLKGQLAAAPFEGFLVYVEHRIFFRHRPPPYCVRAFT
jgi:hypothetical protein